MGSVWKIMLAGAYTKLIKRPTSAQNQVDSTTLHNHTETPNLHDRAFSCVRDTSLVCVRIESVVWVSAPHMQSEQKEENTVTSKPMSDETISTVRAPKDTKAWMCVR